MKGLSEISPFHRFTNSRCDKSVYFWSWGSYLIFLLKWPGSITYLKLMKPKDLGELYAATSDLANQTGIEKTDLLIFHKPNLTSSHLIKTYNVTIAII